ncbi:hypothetical protein V8E36_006391 [Tilletia maclaganii]
MSGKDQAYAGNSSAGAPYSNGGGGGGSHAGAPGRAPSPLSSLAPPPKHSSFYSHSNDRASPYHPGPTGAQTPSFGSGLPSFIERRSSDAFKYNVLPALGLSGPPPSMSRGMPVSPREGRISASAVGPSSSNPQDHHAHHYPSRSGPASVSSRASSIASAAHGGPGGQYRDVSPPPPHTRDHSKSGPPHHVPHHIAQHHSSSLPPPLNSAQSTHPGLQPGPHLLNATSSAVSSFESPQMHNATPAPAYTYRNGGMASRYTHYEGSGPRENAASTSRHREAYSPPPAHSTAASSFGPGPKDGPANPTGHPQTSRLDDPQQLSREPSAPAEEGPEPSDSRANAQAGPSDPPQADDQANGAEASSSNREAAEPSGSSAKGAEAGDGAKGANVSDRKVSCLECRSSKVKCTGKTPDNTPCARCQRIGRPCIFENHRRGRRPDNLKFQKLEKSLETVTRAFADFRKLQDPNAKEGEGSTAKEADKQPEGQEPVKKKARRATQAAAAAAAAAGPEEIGPEQGAREPGGKAGHGPSTSRRGSVQLASGLPGTRERQTLGESSGRRDDPQARAHAGDAGPRHDGAYGSAFNQAPAATETFTSLVPLEADSRSRLITIGAHVPLPDGDLGCDPIVRNVCSLREARDFYDTFMHMQNQYFPCLDPGLHTFDFLRNRSPFLLCVVCYCSARFTEVGTSATIRLQQFIDAVLLPEIWQKGLRSVEIVQGLTLLATFHDLPLTAADDRTWLFLSLAFGQAVQLGLNRRIKLADSAPAIEQRIARNGERSWLTLFLVETICATHMGRRSMFTIDRFIGSSDAWHLHPVALPADRNIVAMVQIRRTQLRLQDLFESTIADPAGGEPALSAYRSDIFIRTCMGELDTWKSTWYDSVSWAPHEQGVSREILFSYLTTTLMQCILVLRANPDGETATSILRQASRTAVDALNVLILVDWPDLVFAINANVVLGSYCAILALRMTTHPKRWRGAGAIDPQYIYDLVDKLIGSLSRPGGTLRRSATALSYASYLSAILGQYHAQHEAAVSKSSGSNVPAKRRRGSEMNVDEFEAGPAGVTMIPKHPHTGLPTLVAPARPSCFSDMTFFETLFEEL